MSDGDIQVTLDNPTATAALEAVPDLPPVPPTWQFYRFHAPGWTGDFSGVG